ncbi:MAG TPA: arginine--tRNA ligase [Candidatus Dormibacteraeota bacterium]|nr:arginine--tRNA ligase [Candidatus Dormibacteraeota bacterium]
MRHDLEQAISSAVQTLFGIEVPIELTRPDKTFGDYATSVALKVATELGHKPRQVAETLSAQLGRDLADFVSQIVVAGPGFINIFLSDKALLKLGLSKPSQVYEGQQILVEFGDPNPLKAMHLGHLYTTIVGDTIARLLEAAGASVKRLSYHGDVGLHVAKAVWGIGETIDWNPARLKELESEEIEHDGLKLTLKTIIGYLYAKGARAFEEESTAADRIKDINKHIYEQDDPTINAIYDWGVERSFKYFDLIFTELGVHFDKRYLESQSSPVGLRFVQRHLGSVFEKSQGAIVYKGEKKGLHTRVFVNSAGLPTYEAKDLGLAEMKKSDFKAADKSIIITANEQVEYFRVMLAALSEFDAQLAAKSQHLTHGFISLATGKMSSRTGLVYGAQELLDETHKTVSQNYPNSKVASAVYLAAIKYTFLKYRLGGDIVFDVQQSVALEGNSGPYLQYAHARARSILAKASTPLAKPNDLMSEERSLALKISEYSEVVDRSVQELLPHHICIYLYELAQEFNHFYEHNRVIGDGREASRLSLVKSYADTLKQGLELLGIPSPEQM